MSKEIKPVSVTESVASSATQIVMRQKAAWSIDRHFLKRGSTNLLQPTSLRRGPSSESTVCDTSFSV